jgi:hypothetical protein
MNLSSLSSQLNISIHELRQRAFAKGFRISPKASKIDNSLAKKLLEVLGQPEVKAEPAAPIDRGSVQLPAFITVRDFAALLKLPVTDIIKTLIKNGVMATINEEVDFETATIIAQDLGFEVETEQKEQVQEFGLGFLHETLATEKATAATPRKNYVARRYSQYQRRQ